ncbi:hypothetical protein MTR62_09755 [Novosphingobium sp. 1949]|uniref:HIRAN domain-containing protein n=1 Tax=Novosphingobium organovorum TaxID=2930092 RepID=A0ABT0BD56_9SPHN|nr:hypothetical protein [Novosphingobium organovorum]MCJ2182975.1 hypothetical protein [Novosphingobium organovorum]
MSVTLFKFALGVRFALAGAARAKGEAPDNGSKGFYLAGKGQYNHEVVSLERHHSALVCRPTDGPVVDAFGRDFLARLAEGRPDSLSRKRIAVHIAGDCIGYLPPSLSTIYAEWAQDWHLNKTLILCRARVLVAPSGASRPCGVSRARGEPDFRVLVDIARPFQIRAFGS